MHDAALGAEIHLERERRQAHLADAFVPRPEEQAHLRLAEAVDGLHRVAHHEHRAPVAFLPAGGEALEQLELAERGVLEFVHQQMADAVVQGQGQVRGLALGAQGMHGGLRHFGEVGLAALPERHLELRHRNGKQLRDGPQRLPLGIGIGGRRQRPQITEGFAERLMRREPGLQRGGPVLGVLERFLSGLVFLRARCGETYIRLERLAPFAVLGQHQRRDPEPGRKIRFAAAGQIPQPGAGANRRVFAIGGEIARGEAGDPDQFAGEFNRRQRPHARQRILPQMGEARLQDFPRQLLIWPGQVADPLVPVLEHGGEQRLGDPGVVFEVPQQAFHVFGQAAIGFAQSERGPRRSRTVRRRPRRWRAASENGTAPASGA